MKSKDDVYRLVFTLIGAVAGLGAGALLMVHLFDRVPSLRDVVGALPLLIIVGLLGGGMMGGGFIALSLVTRRQRLARKKYFDEKKKRKKAKR